MPTNLPDPLTIPHACGPVHARVRLPGSKSYTNRALPIAALARGTSTLRGALDSDDTRYMADALQRLGFAVDADWESATIRIEGRDGTIPASGATLFLGNSGTSVRFLTALATLGIGTFRIDGTERMRQRPLAPLIDGLAAAGVDVRSETGNGCPPVVTRAGGLPGGAIRMPGDVSSQYFSALAMVLPYAQEPLEILVDGELVSRPYIDITAATMRSFGVELHHEGYRRLWVTDGQRYVAREYVIEPDASAASYFYALAAVTGGTVAVEHLPPTSAQGDVTFVDALERMGCVVTRGEHDMTVTGPERLGGIDVDMRDISDTVQTLAAIAPFAESPVTIRNVKHIRYKETDRISALVTELRRIGVRVDEEEDGLTVHPSTPRPATVQTYFDHRMAMSFAIAGTRIPGLSIADPGCVSKTVPNFWDLLLPLLGSSEPGR
ncbi:MAG TPA: 3-phosphoshikimate 1-carboxyvinyltransferase [Thermomicrobiales bacterium]|nr:3-phosphoshikimate 1-carboxyvinyltransferase [Thermomicrobiales bacterium]